MAAGCGFAKAVCAIGITAAVTVLLTFITGSLVLVYGIRYFDE